mgnify:CR=1 FL=1
MEYLRIKSPEVVHETIDGEVVIVNLDKGLYFSTDGIGAVIWSRIHAGHSLADLGSWATGLAGTPEVPEELGAFVTKLLDRDLVEPVSEAIIGGEPLADPPEWSTPELQVFSDMEDLLLLDPIHDVEETAGWPNATA